MLLTRQLRLVTINTGKCDGPYFPRREALASQLAALDADVIALQESFAAVDGSVSTACYLARSLEMHMEFAPARRKVRMLEGRELLSDSGMALLSRRPLTVATRIELPFDPNDGDRAAQVAVLEIGDQSVALANLHLCHLPESGAMRAQQLETVLAHPWLRAPHAACLIMGDLNSTSHSVELTPFFKGEAGWRVLDAWDAGNGRPPRETVARGGGWTAVPKADRCIDFILSVRHDDGEQPSFTSSRLVLNARDDRCGVYPSDHFGVATTLAL